MTIQNIHVPRKAARHIAALHQTAKTPELRDRGMPPVLRWRIDPESGKLACRWTLRITQAS